MAKQRKALGRGLGALIPGADEETPVTPPENAGEPGRRVVEIDITDIEPNPHQPRTEFDPETVDELAQSIR